MMNPKSTKIGVALGSGGWRGLAHIGVLKSLVNHGYTISAISGSSAGALIGGLFAYFQDPEKIEHIFSKLNYKDLLFAFSDPSAKLGLFSGTNATRLIQQYIGHPQIEDLPIPFAAVASDILTGQAVIIDSGDLAEAILASSSVPLVFEPVSQNGRLLIDGGVVNPIPVSTARNLGAEFVIGVDIYKSMFNNPISRPKPSKIDLVNLSYHLLLSKLAEHDAATADLIIEPDIQNLALDPFSKFINNQESINQGEIAMNKQIDSLDRLLQSPKLS